MRLVRLDFTHAVRWTVFTTRRGVASGGGVEGSTPNSHRSHFFHSRKVTVIKYYYLNNDSKNN